MPKRRIVPEPPHVIHPTGVYCLDTARHVLRLHRSSLSREVKEGRLRVSKRCNRHYFLGQWLLDWLAAGELRRQRPAPASAAAAE